MHYDWVIVTAENLADSQAQLNSLDQQNFEVYATHIVQQGDKSCLAIIGRRVKKTADIRY